MSSEKVVSEEEDFVEEAVLLPEFDIKVTKAIIGELQKRGENVLMDDLIEAAQVEEWEVARVLDVLVSLHIAGIERQRGNELRSSRAFAYRNGYALPKQIHLESIKDSILQQEITLDIRHSNIKKLRLQLEQGSPETDREFLDKLLNEKTLDTLSSDLIERFLQEEQS